MEIQFSALKYYSSYFVSSLNNGVKALLYFFFVSFLLVNLKTNFLLLNIKFNRDERFKSAIK